MGKGQGTEWERIGHILIGLGHHDNIGSLRSQSMLCKNKHLSASCLGKSRKHLPPPMFPHSSAPSLARPSLCLSVPANAQIPQMLCSILKSLSAFCFDLCNARRSPVSRGLVHLAQVGSGNNAAGFRSPSPCHHPGFVGKKSPGLNSCLPFDLARYLSHFHWGGGKQSNKSCFLFPP